MSEVVVDIRSLSKRYGATEALSEVSFTSHAGECLALVGHNGSGKTTLMKVLLGLVRSDGGHADIMGHPAGRQAIDRAGIGFLPENIAFDPGMSGRQVMRFLARLKGLSPSSGEPLLERVGLASAASQRVRTYSKGMRQRLGLAQAMLGSPHLLLLDEPTTGLDPQVRRQFYGIIDELKQSGACIILSSHALSELEAQTDRIAILSRGHLIACGTLGEIRRGADLPVRLKATTSTCHGSRVLEQLEAPATGHVLDEHTVIVSCPLQQRMSVLRRLTGMDAVEDVETLPAALEELYAHFTDGTGR